MEERRAEFEYKPLSINAYFYEKKYIVGDCPSVGSFFL